MKKLARLAFLAMVLCLAPLSEALCGGDVLFTFGSRSLDSDAEPVDDHDVYGVFAFFSKTDWPVSLVLGFASSDSGDVDAGSINIGGFQFGSLRAQGEMTEGYIGAGKVWRKLGVRPYVDGGFSVIGVDYQVEELTTGFETDDDDTLIAPYLSTGVFWRIGKWLDLGAGLRYVFFAETVLFDDMEADVNYLQYHAVIGWGW